VKFHFKNQLKNEDQVSIINRQTDPNYATAWRDAVKSSVELPSGVSGGQENMRKFIILLTDGGDNSSRSSVQHVRNLLKSNPHVTVVIIGLLLGDSTLTGDMKLVAEASTDGVYISADDVGQELEDAFTAAASKFNERSQGIQLESLDF